jgi:histone H3/H4
MVENATPSAEKPSKKVPSERQHYIAKASLRRLMKSEGANLVAENVLTLMIEKLEEQGKIVIKKAVEIAKTSNVKRVTAEMIKEVTH